MNKGKGDTKKFNSRRGQKKISLLLVLRALECWSSKETPLRQTQLVEYINNCNDFNVWCDRKTVARHIEVLRDAGYRVEYLRGKGWYLESDRLSVEECDDLLDLVAQSSLPSERRDSIIEKLIYQKSYQIKYIDIGGKK